MNKTYPVSLKKVEELLESIKTWCNEIFSKLGHGHGAYEIKFETPSKGYNTLAAGHADIGNLYNTAIPVNNIRALSDKYNKLIDNCGYIDWSQAVIIRSRATADAYNTKWQSTSAYDISINGTVVCSVSAPETGRYGYESVGTGSGNYTRCITILKKGLLLVTDGSNGVGYCKRGTSLWVPIPMGSSGSSGSICMNVFENDKVMVRSSSDLGSDNDPICIVYAPWVQS